MGQNVFVLVFRKILQAGNDKRLKLQQTFPVSCRPLVPALPLLKLLPIGTTLDGWKFWTLQLPVLAAFPALAKEDVHVSTVKKDVLKTTIATFTLSLRMIVANCTDTVLLHATSTELPWRKVLLQRKSLALLQLFLVLLLYPQRRPQPTCQAWNRLKLPQQHSPVFNHLPLLPLHQQRGIHHVGWKCWMALLRVRTGTESRVPAGNTVPVPSVKKSVTKAPHVLSFGCRVTGAANCSMAAPPLGPQTALPSRRSFQQLWNLLLLQPRPLPRMHPPLKWRQRCFCAKLSLSSGRLVCGHSTPTMLPAIITPS